jgi:hypothetical protein
MLEYLRSLPHAYSIGMQSDQFEDFIYVRREGLLVYECSRRTLKVFGLAPGTK